MRKEERKEINMKERELSEEMLENVSGGLSFGDALDIFDFGKAVVDALKCNQENNWGWKTNAKCSCGLHWY